MSMRKVTIAAALAVIGTVGAVFASSTPTKFSLDERTGAIAALSVEGGDQIATGVENRYEVRSVQGDVIAYERMDIVIRRTKTADAVEYVCTNTQLPGIEITKRYFRERGSIKRELRFLNRGQQSQYLTPFVECHFETGFQTNLWHLGAGYIGPYKPFPKVEKPRPVNEFKQSSKGLVFVHPNCPNGGFAHYRTKIDDTVVLPWWHSTIGHYREYHDRLWYLPDGYRMGLGTFGLYPEKSVAVTDCFTAFDGNLFDFFDDIFTQDRDFSSELKRIPPPPKWIERLYANIDDLNVDAVRRLVEMSDDGDILLHLGPCHGACFCWGDYRTKDGFRTSAGGRATLQELKEHIAAMKALSPRVHVSIYNILVSTSYFSKIFKERPEWYRTLDRDGNRDSLFPGLEVNWQTMWNYPQCRDWYVKMLVDFVGDLGLDTLYIDEMQMTNTIDWQRDVVTRDDDTVKFWHSLAPELKTHGTALFANGSGLPFADLNYMESPHELAPKRWRDWAGVGFGIGMMNRLRPGQRTILLYWTPNVDYENRVLALGWIPRTHSFTYNDVPVMRAVYEIGNLLPVNAKYTPDWKTDATTEVESHALKREQSSDVLISFINRAKQSAEVPVKLDLSTLGFAVGERVNVWREHLNFYRAGSTTEELLSDRELKANWREQGMIGGARITDPELVYSGVTTGELSVAIRDLATDHMEQLLVTAAPLSLFAVDGLPLNYNWTDHRNAQIRGKKVVLQRSADLMLCDREHDFSEVTANGRPVKTRKLEVGGAMATLVSLPAGEWELNWRELPRKSRRTTEVAPIRESYEPERKEITPIHEVKDGVTISKKGIYVTKTEISNLLQGKLPVSATAADEKSLTLIGGTSRRETFVQAMENFAGFELNGAKTMRCRFTHTFGDAISIQLGHVAHGDDAHHIRHRADSVFTGLVIDYRVDGKYTRRISLATGLYSPKNSLVNPPWGKGGSVDVSYELGDWIDGEAERCFSLDLAKLAPEGWDGTAFVSVGTSRVAVGRSMKLEFLGFNRLDADDFVTPTTDAELRKAPPPLMSRPLKKKPNSLTKLDAEEWRGWAKTAAFFKVGMGRPKAATRAYVAHDYEYLYVGVDAEEPQRRAKLANSTAEANEHIEVLVRRPDGVTYQVIGDAKGQLSHYRDRKPSEATKGIIVRGEEVPGKGWRVFFALPIDALKFDMQRTPVEIRYAVTRVRREPLENTACVPMEGFFDYPNYGTLILDFNW